MAVAAVQFQRVLFESFVFIILIKSHLKNRAANRTKNLIEKECANIERRHVFLSASQEQIIVDSVAPCTPI